MLNRNGVTSKRMFPKAPSSGHYFFLIYINDLENGIKSQIDFFADDTSLFYIVHDADLTADDLNHDLNIISEWAVTWKMSFNPDLSKHAVEVIFSHETGKQNIPKIYFNNVEVFPSISI